MPLPLFDEIDLPPDTTLVDVSKLPTVELVQQYQGHALGHWMEETGDDLRNGRDFDPNEGIFVVVENPVVVVDNVLDMDASGDIVGVAVITDVEDA